MTDTTGQQVLDAWLKTHKSIDEDTTQICLSAPDFLSQLLFQPFTLENQVKAKIEMWKYLGGDSQIVGAIYSSLRISYLDHMLEKLDLFLESLETTESDFLSKSLSGSSDLVEKFKLGKLTFADILVTAPGVLFDGWNED